MKLKTSESQLNLILFLLLCLIPVIGTLLYIHEDKPLYEVVVTGTQDQCPCAYEVWRGERIVHTVNNCN